MAEVTVVGAAVADLHFQLPTRFLRPGGEPVMSLPFGDKISADEYHLTPGGSGANVAVGLETGGCSVRFITELSTDTLGQFLQSKLLTTGVKLAASMTESPGNISAVLRIGAERTIITAHTSQLDYLRAPLPESGHLHLGPLPAESGDFYERLMSHLAKTSQPVSYNPGSGTLRERNRHFLLLLRNLKVLFVNQEEAALLARLPSRTLPDELVRSLVRMGPEIVVVTCGAKGAYAGHGDEIYCAPSLADNHQIVDTTGAGDAFTSGFLMAYVDPATEEQQLMQRSLAFGALNSASVIQQIGGQAGLQTTTALERDWQTVRLKKVEAS